MLTNIRSFEGKKGYQYQRSTMSECFLLLWMVSVIDIFGISDERRLVKSIFLQS